MKDHADTFQERIERLERLAKQMDWGDGSRTGWIWLWTHCTFPDFVCLSVIIGPVDNRTITDHLFNLHEDCDEDAMLEWLKGVRKDIGLE